MKTCKCGQPATKPLQHVTLPNYRAEYWQPSCEQCAKTAYQSTGGWLAPIDMAGTLEYARSIPRCVNASSLAALEAAISQYQEDRP